MLAEHGIDIERTTDVARWKNGADIDAGAAIGGVNLFQVRTRNRKHFRTRYGIAGDTAAEIVDLAGKAFLIAFA